MFGTVKIEKRRNITDVIKVFKMAKDWTAFPLKSMFELFKTKHLRGYKF